MGCWHTTCAVSNLPITGGPVAVFLLCKNYSENFCYSDSYFEFCSLPFYAEYDSYGRGENCTGIGLNYIINAIKEQLVELNEGPNKYHDIPAKKETFDVKQLFELSHENRLMVNNNPFGSLIDHPDFSDEQKNELKKEFASKGRLVYPVMVHKTIFNHIINNYKMPHYKDGKMTNISFREIKKLVPEYLANVKDKQEWDRCNPSIISDMFYKRDFLIDVKKENNPDLIIEALKGKWINHFMTNTRKAWIKPIGDGSQNSDHYPYNVLMAAMKKAILKEKYD